MALYRFEAYSPKVCLPRLSLFLFLCLLPALAKASGSGAEFLLLDMDAKVSAMGGAAVARRADLSGLRSNPATIVGLSSPRASFTHLSAFSEWDHDWLAVALPFGANALGLELLSSRLRPFSYYDDLGNEVGTLNAGSLEAAIAYGRALHSVAIGVTARVFRGQLADYSNWGYAGDLGLQWKPFKWACLGAALQHVGTQTAYYQVVDPLPTLWRVGAQAFGQPTQLLGLNAGAEFLQSLDPGRGPEVRLGAEAELFHRLALRGGGHLQDKSWFPSFGLGFKVAGLELNYAYRPVESLGADHMLTLNLQDLSGLFPDEPRKR